MTEIVFMLIPNSPNIKSDTTKIEVSNTVQNVIASIPILDCTFSLYSPILTPHKLMQWCQSGIANIVWLLLYPMGGGLFTGVCKVSQNPSLSFGAKEDLNQVFPRSGSTFPLLRKADSF